MNRKRKKKRVIKMTDFCLTTNYEYSLRNEHKPKVNIRHPVIFPKKTENPNAWDTKIVVVLYIKSNFSNR